MMPTNESTQIKFKSALKNRHSNNNNNNNSSSINEWLSESSKLPSQKKKYQNYDSQRYKYRQINNSEAENDLSNNKHDDRNKSPITEVSVTTTSNNNNNNNHDKDSVANATIVTYESWDSLAMFQPQRTMMRKAKVIDSAHPSKGTYSFKKMLLRFNEECANKPKNMVSLKQVKQSSKSKNQSRKNFMKKGDYAYSKLEHNTIRKWLNRNESKYGKYSAYNQLKNMQMKLGFASLETIRSNEASDYVENDCILKNINKPVANINNKNKVLHSQSTKSHVSRIKHQLFNNLQKSLSQKQKDSKIVNSNNGFISIAKNLRMSYLKATAGKIAKGVYKRKESFKIGKINTEYFSLCEHAQIYFI